MIRRWSNLIIISGLCIHVSSCYSTDDGFELARPVLLVDGYNMCGFWPKLKKYFSRGDLEGARDKLINELITFTHIRGAAQKGSLVSCIHSSWWYPWCVHLGYSPSLQCNFNLMILDVTLVLVHWIFHHLVAGVKVVVVFDATMSGLPNHKEAVNRWAQFVCMQAGSFQVLAVTLPLIMMN